MNNLAPHGDMAYMRILSCCVVSMLATSCKSIEVHPYPVRDTYRHFSRTYGVKLSPESLETWLATTPDVGKIRVAGKVAIFAVCKESDSTRRMKYAEIYLRIYKKIIHGDYGNLEDVKLDDRGGIYCRTGKTILVTKESIPCYIVDFDGINSEANGPRAMRNAELVWLHKELDKLHAFRGDPW